MGFTVKRDRCVRCHRDPCLYRRLPPATTSISLVRPTPNLGCRPIRHMLLLGRSSRDSVDPYGLHTLLLWGPFDIMATLSLGDIPEAH